MRFEFATATRIIFGEGTLPEAGKTAKEIGGNVLLVCGSSPEHVQPLRTVLEKQGIGYAVFQVSSEPTVAIVEQAVKLAKEAKSSLVIAFGGGSAIDAGKAVAALLANGGEVLDYLEVIGRGETLTKPSYPLIAIPTTAGTGAEVTKNAVIRAPEHKVKVSLRSPTMLPRLALVDPELTYNLPPQITASTGLDALTQLIEPFVSAKANPMVDAMCQEGMQHIARSLRRVYEHGDDTIARRDVSLASLLGGLSLANAGLGGVHGFASVIGGMFSAPHGAVCARLLPGVMKANLIALKERSPESEFIGRYEQIACILTGKPNATAVDGITWVEELCEALNIPSLSIHGVSFEDIPPIIEKSKVASSMKVNPVSLTTDEMREILEHALD